MALKGWTLPQSPTGKSSLLPPPPWHYSGEIISADFTADPAQVAELLPPGMSPMGDGSGSFVFADWCSSADRDPRIRDDPAMGQYHEAYCVLYGLFEEKKVSRIPYIWVDSELSLIRGARSGLSQEARRHLHDSPGRDWARRGPQGDRLPLRCARVPARAAAGHAERHPRRNGRGLLSAVGGETAAPHAPLPIDRRQRRHRCTSSSAPRWRTSRSARCSEAPQPSNSANPSSTRSTLSVRSACSEAMFIPWPSRWWAAPFSRSGTHHERSRRPPPGAAPYPARRQA